MNHRDLITSAKIQSGIVDWTELRRQRPIDNQQLQACVRKAFLQEQTCLWHATIISPDSIPNETLKKPRHFVLRHQPSGTVLAAIAFEWCGKSYRLRHVPSDMLDNEYLPTVEGIMFLEKKGWKYPLPAAGI